MLTEEVKQTQDGGGVMMSNFFSSFTSGLLHEMLVSLTFW